MKMPKHWTRRSFLSELLIPFSVIYYLISLIHHKIRSINPYKADKPVVCIGNIVAGGAGKTPTVAYLASELVKSGKNPAIISKGYARKSSEILKVSEAHNAEEVGDEPKMLSLICNVYVASKRRNAIELAIKDGADIILLDDGWQDPSIVHDIKYLVIDGGFGFGNGLVIPAGPLRGKIKTALKIADHIITIGTITADGLDRFEHINANIKLDIPEQADQHYLAFAGIGRPEKFFDSLQYHGLNLADTKSFKDHHIYSDKDIKNLIDQAEKLNAKLITTEKDTIKLPEDFLDNIVTAKMQLEFPDDRLVKSLLELC